MNLLFKGGTVVTAEAMFKADVLVRGETIAAIGENLREPGAYAVDVKGKLLLPGAIDAHTHLECVCSGIDTSDDYATGTRAAACGGTTTVIDYLLQERGERLPDTLRKRVAMATPKAAVDFAFHIGVSDLSSPELLASVGDAVAEGVSSFKAYMVYDFGLDDGQLYALLQETAKVGALTTVHAENRGLLNERVKAYLAEGKTEPWWHYMSRNEAVTAEANRRAIALAKAANAPLYLVHLTDEDGVAAVTEARDQGLPVFAETCPQYLNFTNDVYCEPRGQDYICSPAIKGRASQQALWAALRRGDIQTVATDHCPFTRAEKDYGIRLPDGRPGNFTTVPNGCDGIETMYPYMLTQANLGRISFPNAVAVCAANPAKLFGLGDRKGALRPGLDADLVVFDPKRDGIVRATELHGHLDHTIWENTALHGRITATWLRGSLVYIGNRFVGQKGGGRFQKCLPVAFDSSALA
ncbi:MAG TPA: dihydropyrimidinase [Candidatus Limiplasma sp.]|nr:dihydropyrimidinase [Candidatus Limiplasma sp.]HPS80287.1 dihydropyrimidinase [Candidatus Limiplasma sp.]